MQQFIELLHTWQPSLDGLKGLQLSTYGRMALYHRDDGGQDGLSYNDALNYAKQRYLDSLPAVNLEDLFGSQAVYEGRQQSHCVEISDRYRISGTSAGKPAMIDLLVVQNPDCSPTFGHLYLTAERGGAYIRLDGASLERTLQAVANLSQSYGDLIDLAWDADEPLTLRGGSDHKPVLLVPDYCTPISDESCSGLLQYHLDGCANA